MTHATVYDGPALTLWVCAACLHASETGEYPTGSDADPWSLCQTCGERDCERCPALPTTVGMVWSAHNADCPNGTARQWLTDCDCETVDYSRTPCDACGDPFAGSRHAFTLWGA